MLIFLCLDGECSGWCVLTASVQIWVIDGECSDLGVSVECSHFCVMRVSVQV